MRPGIRIWLVVVATATAAAALHVGVVRDIEPFGGAFQIPWWALAVLVALAEACAIHLEFRRESHTFTLSELPLVAGLLFATPAALLVGRLLGAGVLLVKERRRPDKIAFNLSLFALETAVATIVLHAVVGGGDPFSQVGFAGMFAAIVAASLVGVTFIFVVISISEGSFELRQLREAAAIGTAVTVANTGIALAAAHAVSTQPAFALLLLAPAAVVFFAYRALVATREKHSRLEFLHETSRLIARSKKLETGLQDVLEHTRSTFRADVAEIVLAPPEGARTALRTVVGPGDQRAAMEPFELATGQLVARVLTERRPMLFARSTAVEALASHTPLPGLCDAVIVPLTGETTTVLGTLLVANRLGDVSTFSDEDLKLLETLAGQLGASLENARLEKSLGRLTELSVQLEHQAFHDPLTGLANRALFTERLEHEVAQQTRRLSLLAVLFVDIDDFKAVNDSLGHNAGDELLRAVAERIRSCLREVDTAARLGGDEFAILLQDIETAHDADVVAERVVASLRQPFPIAGELVSATASVGVALATNARSADAVLSDADVAMYRAKARGKAQFTVFETSMRDELFRPIELRRDLQQAIEHEEFALHYQPIVSLTTGRLEGIEALLRWRHPQRTLVPPDEFVPLAEESGLIVEIGRWALREACRQASAWGRRAGGEAQPWISVNISRCQFDRPGLVEDVADALRTSGLDPHRLVLEITESIASLDDKSMATVLDRLKGLGVRLALDDFGSGYSSLGLLQTMPLDVLKIDRQFVQSMGSGSQATQLTKTIVQLARTLGLTTVAEGIELRDQLDVLAALGCDLGQGFLFARPLDATAVEALLSREQAEPRPAGAEPDRARRLRALDGGRRSA